MDPFYFELTADKGATTSDKVAYGGSFNHIWTLIPDTDIVSCTASDGPGNWSTNPTKATSPSPLSQLVTNALVTATSTLSCTNFENKTLVRTMVVYVKSPPPIIDFTADDYNIGYNSAANLLWTTQNIDSCTGSAGDPGWAGSKAIGVNKTYTSGGLIVDTTFNMTCYSSYPEDYPDPTLATLEITIQKLIVDFHAEDLDGNLLSENSIFAYTDKDNINLAWITEFATRGCVASDDWSGQKVPVNSANDQVDGLELAPIADGGIYTYTLTCDGEYDQHIVEQVTLRLTKNPDFSEEITNDLQ